MSVSGHCRVEPTRVAALIVAAVTLVFWSQRSGAEPVRLLVPTVTVYPGQPVYRGRLEF